MLFPELQPIANKIPDDGDMMNALKEVYGHWEKILLNLKFSIPKITSIRSENQGEFMQMMAGLNVWKRSRPSSPTWQGLINALLECDLLEAVERVEQKMREKFHYYNDPAKPVAR